MTQLGITHGQQQGSKERAAGDLYSEPEWVTTALLQVERFHGNVIDPACGRGHIISAVKSWHREQFRRGILLEGEAKGSDISQDSDPAFDFLSAEWCPEILPVHCIICNPPYKHADEFVLKALGLARIKVAMFLKLVWLQGQDRYRRLFSIAAPTRVWVIPRRVGMWRGDEEEAHDGGTVSYCWCVWDLQAPAQPGRSDLRWLPLDGLRLEP